MPTAVPSGSQWDFFRPYALEFFRLIARRAVDQYRELPVTFRLKQPVARSVIALRRHLIDQTNVLGQSVLFDGRDSRSGARRSPSKLSLNFVAHRGKVNGIAFF